MRAPYAAITAEGYHSIFLSAFSSLIFALIGCWPVAFILLLLTGFACHFFRDPERIIPDKKNIAVSPADGKIIRIASVTDPLNGESRQCVSIFMNVLNVHVNRIPVSGTVKAIEYKAGRFLNASLNKASEDNERCLYSIQDRNGDSWTMVQVAGLIARRIVCRVDRGEDVTRGERFGMIKFGSRVDLYIPDGYIPAVMVGDVVMAGSTILAHKEDD